MTELTLFIRSQVLLRLNCFEMLWLYIDKSRLQGISQSFYSNYPKTLYHGISVYPYGMWLVKTCFCLYWKLKPRSEEQIPCHYSFSNGIICGPHQGSFAARDHLRSNLGIISGLGIICGRGSFAALYSNLLDKKRCIKEQIFFDLLYVTCIYVAC